MIADYESTTKEFGAMMRGANIPFHYDVISSDDFHYYYALPMKSMGDVDKIMQIFMVELPQKVGKDKLTAMMRRGGATMEKANDWIVVRRDDISYKPAKPRLKPEEMKHARYDYYYLRPGMEDLVDQIANEWKAASAAANLGDGFTIYQAIVAADLPFIVVETVGKDPADLAAQSAKNMQALGDRARTLNNRTFDVVRRFESKFGRPRPDLSNPAPKAP